MRYRGKLSVLTALSRGEPVLVYVNGGALSCVFSLGVFMALVMAELAKKFAARYGSSGGAINLAASLSNPWELDLVFEVYKHLVSGRFIRWQWDWFGRGRIVFDIDELFHVLEGRRVHLGLRGLNGEKICNDPAPFRVAVTDRETGKGKFLDVKHDVFHRLRATSSIQGACPPVKEADREVGDGDVGKKIGPAFAKAAKRVLVILNRPPVEERWWGERDYPWVSAMVTELLLWGEPEGLRKAATKMDQTFSRGLRRLEACTKLDTLVLYPDMIDDLWPLTAQVPMLEYAMQKAKNDTLRLLEQAHAV